MFTTVPLRSTVADSDLRAAEMFDEVKRHWSGTEEDGITAVIDSKAAKGAEATSRSTNGTSGLDAP